MNLDISKKTHTYIWILKVLGNPKKDKITYIVYNKI